MSSVRLLLSASVMLFAACTQMPTEKQNVVDMRPQLSFKVMNESALRAKVYVDDQDVGTMSDYVDGKAAIRVLPGNHLVRVQLDGSTIHEERIFVSDGVNRALIVK